MLKKRETSQQQQKNSQKYFILMFLDITADNVPSLKHNILNFNILSRFNINTLLIESIYF